jgi:hypothetical protein
MVQEARSKPVTEPTPSTEPPTTTGQLPTPPDEMDDHLRRSPAPSPHGIMLDAGSLDVSEDIFHDPPAYSIEDLDGYMPGSLVPRNGYWGGPSGEGGAPGLERLTDMRDMMLRDRRLDSPASSTDALPDLDDVADDATFHTYPDRQSGTSSSQAWTPEARASPARSTSSARSLFTDMNVDSNVSDVAHTPFSDGEVPLTVPNKFDNSGKLSEE